MANGLQERIASHVLDKIAKHAVIKLLLKSFWHQRDAGIAKLFDLGSLDRFAPAVGKGQCNGIAGFFRNGSRQRTAIVFDHDVAAILWFDCRDWGQGSTSVSAIRLRSVRLERSGPGARPAASGTWHTAQCF